MTLNATPVADRTHIGIFGKRNAGKSCLINAITAQNIAIVSDIRGTTTDPVYKTMELAPLGPVVFIDTPGLDDEGDLGTLRIKKTYQVLNKTDIALLVIDAVSGLTIEDESILKKIKEKNIPYRIVMNKIDLNPTMIKDRTDILYVSAEKSTGIDRLKESLAHLIPAGNNVRLIGDFLKPSDMAVLVIPIDKAAPKGRLILPQQQTIRDILDSDATALVVKENALCDVLAQLNKKPKIVITDSQVFDKVAMQTPSDILLTSFSILFARLKGNLAQSVAGVRHIDFLKDGDSVLISEGCSHHRQCDDIGSVKIPKWLSEHTGKKLNFVFSSGTEFPDDLTKYALIVHCGGCMLNEREVRYRFKCASDLSIPMTNYGILIAYLKGILPRSVQLFPDIAGLLSEKENFHEKP